MCFWASWCKACLDELTDHADDLREIGLDVLALSVDGVADQGAPRVRHLALLDEIKFPFKTGSATREMLDKLKLVHRVVFNQQIPFQVPLSLLIDRDGHLAVVYRGAVDRDTLAAAYAEVGQYADAVRTAEQALHVIGPKAKDAAAVIDGRLELYRANTKYREPTNLTTCAMRGRPVA